jgi:hypothetical protein
MKTLDNFIIERLKITANTSQLSDITYDMFFKRLTKFAGKNRRLILSDIGFDNFIVCADNYNTNTVLGKLKGSSILTLEAVTGIYNFIDVRFDNKFQTGLSVTDLETLVDIFGEEQLIILYDYMK